MYMKTGVPKRHLVEMNSHQQDYYFDVEEKPTNVIVDAEHVLLAEIFDEKPDELVRTTQGTTIWTVR